MKDRNTGILSSSDRAIAAKSEGKLVFSKLSAWQKQAVKAGVMRSCEWHHTGAAANRTDFYDPLDFSTLLPSDFPPTAIDSYIQSDTSRLRITITYKKLVGGYSQGSKKKYETITVTGLGVRKSDTLITGACGRRLSSNNDLVLLEYKAPKSRTWKEISKKEAESLGYGFI